MKIKELQELRKKEVKDLFKMVSEKKLKLAKVKAEMRIGKEKNLKIVKNLTKEIAKILTIMRESELLAKIKPASAKKEGKK